jgi:hypothetical protein
MKARDTVPGITDHAAAEASAATADREKSAETTQATAIRVNVDLGDMSNDFNRAFMPTPRLRSMSFLKSGKQSASRRI